MLRVLHFNFDLKKAFACVGLLALLQLFAGNVLADSVVWNFTALTSAAATSSNTNVPASGCIATIGNSLGTVSTPINATSASSTYSGATGGGNIGNAVAVTGNATFSTSSPYISFTLVPNAGYTITVNGIAFGSRCTSTGPQAYTVSTSVGGFGTGVASGTLLNNSVWALQTPSFTTVTGTTGTAIEVRIYAYGGAGSASSGTENWRIDDINFNITVAAADNAPAFTGGTSQALSLCQNSSATSINSLMAISDLDAAQTETWTITSGPANGTLGGFPTSASSTGSTVTPSGLTYTPTTGFSGTDAFTVQISDGILTATTAVTVTVNPLPSTPSAITGTATVCTGSTTTLSETTTGGTWTSTDGTIATAGSTGIVTGIAAGMATISYTVTNSCGSSAATAIVTVNTLPSTPSAITGTATVCAGSTTTLSETTTGGTWSSTDGTIATVGTTGIINGVAAGTATISYTVTNGCGSIAVTDIVTVNPLPSAPAAITGTATVCVASTTTLTETTTGGTWSSTSGSIATVGTTGIVTGVANGTVTISYTVANSCGSAAATDVLTVNPLPVAGTISGIATVTVGSTTTLTNSVSGGTWSSAGTSVATAGTSGIVTGVSAGTATISYSVTNVCGTTAATIVVTVNPAAFGRGNLVVLRTGDGSAALSSSSTAIFAVEYTTTGSATGFSVALPTTTVSGIPPITNSGSATSEGQMTLSAERDRLVLEGYNAPTGVSSITGTTATANPRELFTINSSGVYAVGSSSSTAYSGNNIRSGTASGTNFFSAGTASSAPNGIVYLNSSTALATTPTNTRVVQVFNGQLYFSASSSPFLGVSKMGTGIPTTSGQTATQINATNASSAYGFSISPDGTTLYIADDAAGITKYTGSGTSYTLLYNVNTTASRGLVVDYSGTNPVIYATAATGSTIIKITDIGAASAATTIATAPTNTAFRGLQFSPSCFASVSISGASTICSGSSTSLLLTGNPNAYRIL